jgi:hypothetical protein
MSDKKVGAPEIKISNVSNVISFSDFKNMKLG